jgi:tRNA threonylcarbamoyl adenosine modification protein (Sua5/YciO/YrdC/YwlC family)|tara:strand:- start:2749 stop:3318 length:570 start_codon:yes stop_codon:yes gene_type:complete
MRVLSKEEFEKEKDIIRTSLIENNPVFIYPTDTIYGIGCSAINKEAVDKIRDIKQRKTSPFSVIAPSKEWIDDNCIVNDNAKDWIKRLPGPYTLILKTKKQCVADNVAPGLEAIGVRIPDHWFSNFVSEIDIPIITTSANKSGNDCMTSLEDLDSEIKSRVDFIVYEGEKKGTPSKIIDLTDEEKVVER